MKWFGSARAREALGLPVPPAWAALGAFRVRAALGNLHARTTPGFSLVLERLFGLVDTKALHTAVVLGLPDRLAKGPLSAGELATETGADPDAVERLLRFLVSRGFFRYRRNRYSNNAASDVLRADHPYTFRDWVLFFGSDWNLEIWKRMPERVATGRSATEGAYGVSFFSYTAEKNPGAGRIFNGAMAAGSRLQGILFAENISLADVSTVCDIGGGTGSVLIEVLKTHPAVSGAVFDLPSVESEARSAFAAANVTDRASFVGGDFFERVPRGFDLYTMFAVIHDWSDDDNVRILSNVAAALGSGGRIMVIEGTLPGHQQEHFLKASDMLMLVLGDGGRERTERDFDRLWTRAGLVCRRTTTLPSTFRVFELVPR